MRLGRERSLFVFPNPNFLTLVREQGRFPIHYPTNYRVGFSDREKGKVAVRGYTSDL